MNVEGTDFMNICLYGASSDKIDKTFMDETQNLGNMMAERGHSLVYGGGATGLMGAAARGVYEKNGKILGVAPKFFSADGILFENCTKFIYTETMRERKRIMEENADAFIVTPGGIGTFEEFFEILTLKQLGRHNKAIAVFNISGYYDIMKQMLDDAIAKDFMKENCNELYKFFDNADEMMEYIENYTGVDTKADYYKNI